MKDFLDVIDFKREFQMHRGLAVAGTSQGQGEGTEIRVQKGFPTENLSSSRGDQIRLAQMQRDILAK